jgi:type I restriction enzyme S subunit
MNATQLLAHFDRVAEAPNAVPRLRRFILDLAVRGKLVEQDAADEPAAELLKRIPTTRSQSLKKSFKRNATAGTEIDSTDIELPSGWAWSKLGELCTKTGSGSTPSGGKDSYVSIGVPFLRSQNVYDEGLRLDGVAFISESTQERMSSTTVKPGDLLLNITGGSIGRCAVVPDSFVIGNINQHVAIIRLALLECRRFLHSVICSDYFQQHIFGNQTGAGREGLPKNRMDEILIPVPPLAEQHRIVSKVDALMALCDQLEAAQQERERRCDRLAAASLQRLNQPALDASPEAQREHARFHLHHLPRLTNRPEHIKAMRQTILNLAVGGKLVRQDSSDEPAAALLKRIAGSRSQILAGGEARKKKPVALNGLIPIELPSGWGVEALANLVDPLNTISYGVLVPGPEVEDGIPFVRVQDLALSGHPARPNKSIAPDIESPYSRTRLKGGEVLLCVVGSIGKVGLAPTSWAGANIARAVCRISPMPGVDTLYLLILFQSAFVQGFFADSTRTLAQPTLNVGLIEQLPVLVPPLAEQHRIVTKVDELMALCDQLEAQLTTTQTDSRRLLEAVLESALAPA